MVGLNFQHFATLRMMLSGASGLDRVEKTD